MERKIITLLAIIAASFTFAQFPHTRVYSTFDNLPLTQSDTFNNGADRSGGFTHYGRFFNNEYDTTWASWSGWALSNRMDATTAGYENQFSAIPGHGVSYTSNYMISTGNGAYIKLDSAGEISGAYFTNTTYAYYDMKNGSGFSKQFGGVSGNDADYFKLIIKGFLSGSEVSSVDFYLADFRNADNSKDYILDDWTYVDFNNDGLNDVLVDSISFSYESSDVGQFGMNTPAYFGMDDFNSISDFYADGIDFPALPEDTYDNGADGAGGFKVSHLFYPNTYNADWQSWEGWSISTQYDDTTAGYENQYSSVTPMMYSTGNWINHNFHFVNSGITNEIRTPYKLNGFEENIYGLTRIPTAVQFGITNATYAYLDMVNGSSFSKKFGGLDGNDPDYFRLLINSVNNKNEVVFQDTVYLADFRFSDNTKDFILKEWEYAEIRPCDKITFELQSSDVGFFGMNTPAYFCMQLWQLIVGIENREEKANVQLYPNPVLSDMSIMADDRIETVAVFSLDGKQLDLASSQISTKRVDLNTQNLVPGIYVVRVQTEKGIATKKFIKQ